MRAITFTLLIFSLLSSGCSWIKFPGVHKVDIQQGNLIEQNMVDKLELGMTKSQVRFVLGNPLIADTFDQTRWDYIYRRVSSLGVYSEKSMTVHFDDQGLLKEVEGDFYLDDSKTDV
jgi:outer membrane protein assembly factor BamE